MNWDPTVALIVAVVGVLLLAGIYLVGMPGRPSGIRRRHIESPERLEPSLGDAGPAPVEAAGDIRSELDEVELWTGPENMFRAAGFAVVQDDPRRPVLAIELENHG